ncbi:MAG: DUF2333 family protein [Beggiatoa sp.]|nr:DUF2333 family protein [Beggiatoa sp.]
MARIFTRTADDLPAKGRSWFWVLLLPSPFVIAIVGMAALGFYWDSEPDLFDVKAVATDMVRGDASKLVPGSVTTATLIHVATVLLDKPGGYLSNDMMPPSILMDNIPNWEQGVLQQIRDLARVLRNDLSRSQSQSSEDADLSVADPRFHFDPYSWQIPSAEGEFRVGLDRLKRYLMRLQDPARGAEFHARADNLREWLRLVGTRLGDLAQRLSASVGQVAPDPGTSLGTATRGTATQAPDTDAFQRLAIRTPWLQLDDVLYDARGAAWAILHFLRAAQIDFEQVLRNKNAQVSLRQVIRELEQTQTPVWSPVILNGTGFGLLANHSLVMASYISRANAALIDLQMLLVQG